MKKKTFIKLTNGEPIIDIVLRPTEAYIGALKAANKPVPADLHLSGLIDTGFTGGLMVAESAIKSLGLKTRGWSQVGYPQEADPRYFSTYVWDVDIGIKFQNCSHNGGNVLIDTFASMVEFVNDKNSQVLIGQKVLQFAIFFYNGPKDYFTLEFPK